MEGIKRIGDSIQISAENGSRCNMTTHVMYLESLEPRVYNDGRSLTQS